MIRLNPYAKAATKAARAVEQSRLRQKEALLNKKRGVSSNPLSIWIIKKKICDSLTALFGSIALGVFNLAFR